jgi:ABC-type multidrug transport system fused ATPase/permease subunit
MGAYLGFIILALLSSFGLNFLIDALSIRLSKNLHHKIVDNLLKASFPKFYNLIMTGRLMNRLSNDIL